MTRRAGSCVAGPRPGGRSRHACSTRGAHICGKGASPGTVVYHLILGEEATVQHVPPSGPNEVGDLIPNHAGLGRGEETERLLWAALGLRRLPPTLLSKEVTGRTGSFPGGLEPTHLYVRSECTSLPQGTHLVIREQLGLQPPLATYPYAVNSTPCSGPWPSVTCSVVGE